MTRQGFDNQKYLTMQSQHIQERIAQFGGKLYLEFGGKLFDDFHASRVLPGFEPDSKIRMLAQMKDKAEIVLVINAADIEKNKVRGDLGITYDSDVLRLIDAFRGMDLYVGSVVVTQYAGQQAADLFQKRLESWVCGCTATIPSPATPTTLPDRLRRGLWQERVRGDHPSPGGDHRPRPGQRQDGHLPQPALPRAQAWGHRRLRQV